MSKIITVNDLNSSKYYQLPKAFFHNPIYIDMKNESKIAYALLRDLLELSIKNNWINDAGEVYVKISRDKMMSYLHMRKDKYAAVMKELTVKELIVKKRVGLNKVDETYLCMPEELNNIYSDEELLLVENDTEIIENTRRSEKPTSSSLKNRPQEVCKTDYKKSVKPTHTNTNITETNITKTNSTTTQDEIACSKFKGSESDNIGIIELETHLKLSDNQKKEASAFNIERLKKSIKIFNDKNGKYFALLKKIYKDDGNFVSGSQKDNFNNFEQRSYDMEVLEDKLLNWRERIL